MILREAVSFGDDKPAVVPVRNSDKMNAIAIGLKKGQVLKKHITPFPALLVVLQGAVSFDMEGTQTQLPASATFDIPANVPHEVTGLEESIFIVVKEKG